MPSGQPSDLQSKGKGMEKKHGPQGCPCELFDPFPFAKHASSPLGAVQPLRVTRHRDVLFCPVGCPKGTTSKAYWGNGTPSGRFFAEQLQRALGTAKHPEYCPLRFIVKIIENSRKLENNGDRTRAPWRDRPKL